MAQVTIGGEAVSVSLNNYKRLKQAWRYIDAATQNPGFVPGMDAIIGAIAVGLDKPLDGEPADTAGAIAYRIDWIDENLTPLEIPGLKPFMNALLIESGLAEKPGEPVAVAAPAESPSTEISTPSSPN